MNKNYLGLLINLYNEAKNADYAEPMEKYMKNNFKFLGIKTPARKEIYKEFFSINGLPEIEKLDDIIYELWKMPEREYQYFAIALMDKMTNKFSADTIFLLEYMIVNKSWWDSVDGIAPNLVSYLFIKYPDLIKKTTEKWMKSENIWLCRSCILFQLKHKNKTDFKLLTDLILQCSGSKEFFVQKAIGWALREYSKTNPEAVIDFIENNQLPALSVREGLKRINR